MPGIFWWIPRKRKGKKKKQGRRAGAFKEIEAIIKSEKGEKEESSQSGTQSQPQPQPQGKGKKRKGGEVSSGSNKHVRTITQD